MSKRYGSSNCALVAVRGVEPHHDLLALGDRLAADLGVLGGGAAEVDHRRRPAHDLLDRVLRVGVEVARPQRALVGVLLERPHPVADRGAGGLVAGDDEQDEERRELGDGQPLTVDLGVHERAW